jgi:hypothetical protein
MEISATASLRLCASAHSKKQTSNNCRGTDTTQLIKVLTVAGN